jgi:hypothetical protein
MNLDDYGLINLVIAKEEIESFDFGEIYNFLLSAKDNPKTYYNKLNIIVYGYDNDNRELYEISEVRTYLDFLDKSFPYWFYFINLDIPKSHSFLSVLITCLCKLEFIGPDVNGTKTVEFSIEDQKNFILNHFGFMNEIMDQHNYPEKEIKRRSQLILKIVT